MYEAICSTAAFLVGVYLLCVAVAVTQEMYNLCERVRRVGVCGGVRRRLGLVGLFLFGAALIAWSLAVCVYLMREAFFA